MNTRIQLSILATASALAAGAVLLAALAASARQLAAAPAGHSPARPAAPRDDFAFAVDGQAGGRIGAIDLSGSLAFVGIGPRLGVVDLADPARPALLGLSPILHGVVLEVLVDGATAFVVTDPTSVNFVAGDDARLVALDVSDPRRPTPIGMLDTGGSNARLALTASDLLWASVDTGDQGSGGKVMAVDARDPRRMAVLGEADLGRTSRSITVVGENAVVAPWADQGSNQPRERMRVFEARPTVREIAAVEFARVDGPFSLSILVARDDLLYGYGRLAAADGVRSALQVYDVSDPARPAYLRAVSFQVSLAHFGLMAIDGAQAYLLRTRPGAVISDPKLATIQRVDLSDPRNPRLLPPDPISAAMDLVPRAIVAGGGLLIWVDHGLRLLDYRSPDAPELRGSWRGVGIVSDVAVAGAQVYTIDTAGLVTTLRRGAPGDALSPLSAVQAVTATESLSHSDDFLQHELVLEDGRLFAGTNGELAELSLARPEQPAVIWSTFVRCLQLAAGEGLLYVGREFGLAGENPGPDSIAIFDTSSGPPQARVRWFTPRGSAFAAAGKRLFVDNTSGVVEVVDLSDSARPVVLGKWLGDGAVSDIALRGDLVVFTQAATPRGLVLLDASDPSAIRQVGFLPLPLPWSVAVDGDIAYVTVNGGAGDLVAVDISDPSRPAVLASFPIHHRVTRLVAEGGTVWLPMSAGGLWRLRLVRGGAELTATAGPGVEPTAGPTPGPGGRRVALPWLGR